MSMRLDRDAIMPSLLHSGDKRFCLWKNHWLTCVWASKFHHRIHGIEAEKCHEFYFVAVFANKQFRAVITPDFSRGDARKNLIAQQFFVRIRVCTFRPSVPNTCDHPSFCW
jgi:hypothetical protein